MKVEESMADDPVTITTITSPNPDNFTIIVFHDAEGVERFKLFTEDGNLKWQGSSGKITVLAGNEQIPHMTDIDPFTRCFYDHLCTEGEPCVYHERDRLRAALDAASSHALEASDYADKYKAEADDLREEIACYRQAEFNLLAENANLRANADLMNKFHEMNVAALVSGSSEYLAVHNSRRK